MCRGHYGLARSLAAGALLLAGCVPPAGRAPEVPAAELLAQLPTGRPLLDCREPCLAQWKAVEPQARQSEAAGYWRELATLVLRSRYQDDLTLYYLGRAAEGLGYPVAAASYYRQSQSLSGTAVACEWLSRDCGGIILPRAAAQRLAAIERPLEPARHRNVAPAPARVPSVPAAVPGRVAPIPLEEPPPIPARTQPQSTVEWPEPAPLPAATPAPAPAPAPPPTPEPRRAASPPTQDYIEPPPAR